MGPSRRGLLALLAALPFARSARAATPRQVLAFYYGWYGLNPPRHWPEAGEAVTNRPAGGPYDSGDPAVAARHVQQAKAAGITGLVASWWGEGDATDQNLAPLLEAAVAAGLTVCAYVEQAADAAGLEAQLAVLERRAAHRAWLRAEGRPVVFLFDRVMQTLGEAVVAEVAARWRGRLFLVGPANDAGEIASRSAAFDALHIYSLTFVTDGWPRPFFTRLARRWMQRWTAAQPGRVRTATVLPGFDDRPLRREGQRPTTPRRGGATYRALWEAAIAARPDWVLIVSFNEWHEGSEIEPSAEHGERELAATREMAARFLAG